MDILKPGFVYIDDLCFRRNFVPEFNEFLSDKDLEHDEGYIERENVIDCNEELNDEYKIDFKNGYYVYSYSVPLPSLPFIIGTYGIMRKKIENETKSTLLVPKKNEGNIITITGNTKAAILSARTRIMLIVMNSRFKLDATHFLSLPINDEILLSNYNNFMEDLIKNFKVDKDLFQTAEKLHLTIGMLHLLDTDDIASVGEIFQQAKNRLNELSLLKDPIVVKLKGLEYMNDDPSRVNVLYAKIDPQPKDDNRLQIICDELMNVFIEKGFLKKEYDRVKLHVTVMNTRYSKNIKSFDITEIMKKHREYEFGEMVLKGAYISERYSTDATTKYFKTAHSIEF